MPFMQRITWSGIALHAGVLPGRPASHGCIRMPYGFAERLFEVTKLGLRVVVVRDDMSPVEILPSGALQAGPDPFASCGCGSVVPTPPADDLADAAHAARCTAARRQPRRRGPGARSPPPSARRPRGLTEKAEEARRAAVKAHAEFARTMKSVRIAEHTVRRAEMQLEDIERELADKSSAGARGEEGAAIVTALSEAQAQVDALRAEVQGKHAAVVAAREAARAAETARSAAATAAKIAENKLAPVSVLISRQTQTLYVRQGFRPIFDTPVTIRDPDAPIGTTIFTAVNYIDDGADVRWTALAMYPGADRDTANRWREGATPWRVHAKPSRPQPTPPLPRPRSSA